MLANDQFARRGRVAVQTEAFRARAKIRPTSLAELVGKSDHLEVKLPGPCVDSADVGDPGFYYALGAIVGTSRPRAILEIGTFLGVSTLVMAMNAPEARITTVDLPSDGADAHGLTGTDLGLSITARARCGEAFAQTPYTERITQLRVDSRKLDPASLGQFDLVFIDGGHTAEIVKADTATAMAIVADGGSVIWDDYWWYYRDVVKYLNELSDSLPLHRIEDTNLVIWKS
jgi:hypothetical protein